MENSKNYKMTDEIITALVNKGFNRWTKGNLDRLYINATKLGLVCRYYKTGNISDAFLNGYRISNSEARRMKAAKTFIDIKTGTVYSDNSQLKAAAEALIEKAIAEKLMSTVSSLGNPRARKWFAARYDDDSTWDFGSFDLAEAVRMAKEERYGGEIDIIEADYDKNDLPCSDPFCVGVVYVDF